MTPRVPAADLARAVATAELSAGHCHGLAIAIVENGVPPAFICLGAVGGAGTGPVDTEVVFRMGSVGKALIGCGLRLLQQEAAISIDDPVARYLPGLPECRGPLPGPATLTLRHLVTHSSGLPRDFDGSDVPPASALTLGFQPGTRHGYSNADADLAAQVIAEVTDEEAAAWLLRRIAGPARMAGATLDDLPLGRPAVDGFMSIGKKLEPIDEPEAMLSRPGGALRGTIADLAAWTRVNMAAWSTTSSPDAVLPAHALRETHLPAGYGLPGPRTYGWFWQTERSPGGHVLVSISGGTLGCSASIFFAPDHGLGAAVLANAGAPRFPARSIARAICARAVRDLKPIGETPGLDAAEAVLAQLLSAPDPAVIERAFAPDLVRRLGAGRIADWFASIARPNIAGTESGMLERLDDDDPTSAEWRFADATGGPVKISLTVDPGPPYLIRLFDFERELGVEDGP